MALIKGLFVKLLTFYNFINLKNLRPVSSRKMMVDHQNQKKEKCRESFGEVLQLQDAEIQKGMTYENYVQLRKQRMSIAVSHIHEKRQSRISAVTGHCQAEDKQLQLDDVIKCFRMIVQKQPKIKSADQQKMQKESELSREIKVLAEVEKIWILYDVDGNGLIDKAEISEYLRHMAQPKLELTDEEINQVFEVIDVDCDDQIDKEEMECFFKVLMIMQNNLSFKSSELFYKFKFDEQELKTKGNLLKIKNTSRRKPFKKTSH